MSCKMPGIAVRKLYISKVTPLPDIIILNKNFILKTYLFN